MRSGSFAWVYTQNKNTQRQMPIKSRYWASKLANVHSLYVLSEKYDGPHQLFLGVKTGKCLRLSPTHPLLFHHHLCSSQSGHLFCSTHLKLSTVREWERQSFEAALLSKQSIQTTATIVELLPHSTTPRPSMFCSALVYLSPNTSEHPQKLVIVIVSTPVLCWLGY